MTKTTRLKKHLATCLRMGMGSFVDSAWRATMEEHNYRCKSSPKVHSSNRSFFPLFDPNLVVYTTNETSQMVPNTKSYLSAILAA